MTEVTERYVAIDNVCAWPNLTRLGDGTLVATIFNQPTHGGWEGDVECWASEDGGRRWELRGVPAAHEPGTNRMNVAAGLAADGSLVVIASGWSLRPEVGTYANPHDGEVLAPWVCRSADGARAWTREGSVEPPPGPGAAFVPFGDIVPMGNGELGVCFYSQRTQDEHLAYFYASGDDGRTWKPRGTVHQVNTNETTPVVLPDGGLLAAARTRDDGHLEMFFSEDQGATWSPRGPVTLGAQHPGHLLVLQDGRVLLTYGMRNRGMFGVGVRFSEDGGRTWGRPELLVNLGGLTDGGYPSTAQVEDGVLVTAYYCKGTEAHSRYHMGVVRWQLD